MDTSQMCKIEQKELEQLGTSSSLFFCLNCKPYIFPFSSLDDEEFVCTIHDISDNYLELYDKCSSYNFEPFICAENEKYFEDIDPDQQFFNKVCIDCRYYTVNKFQQDVRKVNGISLIHFNCRSIRKNFQHVIDYLHDIDYEFDVIAFSETWENNNDCNDKYIIQGYDSFFCIQER